MEIQTLLHTLEKRFNLNMHRHPNLKWEDYKAILTKQDKLIRTVNMMEETGGEPDVVEIGKKVFVIDMVKETPLLRRNVCYDEKARLSRKKFPPETSAEALALKIGINLTDEELYRQIQKIEPLDMKTSSWILTPEQIRSLGGALFGDFRYDHTFIYHNGADSYYGSRGFRGFIEITIS